MRITCETCGHVHKIPDERVPRFGARLRCAGCSQLFELPPRDRDELPFALSGALATGEPAATRAAGGEDAFTGTLVEAIDLPEPEPAPDTSIDALFGDEPEEDAARLARMLLTDIVYADAERVARARREGRILKELGPEIERAHRHYRRRVGVSFARRTNHFRAALLEILAGR